MQNNLTPQSPTMGIIPRVVAAGKMLVTGKKPTNNPLADEPKDKSRGALVEELTQWCLDEREFWKPMFERMREEQRFAAGQQWQMQYASRTGQKEPFVGDVVQQMVNRMTASLYAKNPTPEAVINDRLWFQIWDGNQATIEAAQQLVAAATPMLQQAAQLSPEQKAAIPPPPPQLDLAQEVIADYQQGMAKKQMLAKVSKTGEMLIAQSWKSQSPDMLVSGKQAVTQALVSRVAYVKVMYRRDMESVATETANDMEFSDRLNTLQAQLRQIEQDSTGPDDPKVAEAKLLKASLVQEIEELKQQQPPPVAGDEGVVHDWLGSTSILIDRNCTCLREFIGAKRIAHEMMMTVSEAEAKYQINLQDTGAKYYVSNSDGYKRAGTSNTFEDNEKDVQTKRMKICVWEIQDKPTGQTYTIIDGVKDFIKEPESNQPEVSRFWSIVPITFNCQVVEENDPLRDVTIFPRSAIRLAMPMQLDINTAGEGIREHRVANRPSWCAVKSKFATTAGKNDLEKLAAPRSAFDVFSLEALMSGEKIADFIQPTPMSPIDPKMYDNYASSQAMMLATGEQPSDIGAQRPDEKATGQNIAAQARATSVGSNIDDLDFAYGAIAQMDWEMLVQEMPAEIVKEIVGPGAVWPDLARDDIARSIYFKISAGSSGKPNEQADLNNFQVIAPQLSELMQAAGLSLEPLIKEGVRRLGDKLDVDEFLKPAQVQPPPAQQPEPQKPPSIAITLPYQSLQPEVQDQVVQMAGMKPPSPASTILNKIGHAKAVEATHHNNQVAQGQPPTNANQQ